MSDSAALRELLAKAVKRTRVVGPSAEWSNLRSAARALLTHADELDRLRSSQGAAEEDLAFVRSLASSQGVTAQGRERVERVCTAAVSSQGGGAGVERERLQRVVDAYDTIGEGSQRVAATKELIEIVRQFLAPADGERGHERCCDGLSYRVRDGRTLHDARDRRAVRPADAGAPPMTPSPEIEAVIDRLKRFRSILEEVDQIIYQTSIPTRVGPSQAFQDAELIGEAIALLAASPPPPIQGAWRPTSEAPKDGTMINVRFTRTFKWTPYKPDGRRQMRAEGRWQAAGEYGGWDNAKLPDDSEWTPTPVTSAPPPPSTTGGAR